MARLGDVCVINPKAPLIDDATMVSFVPMPRVGEKGEFDSSEIRPYIEVKKGFTYFADGDVLFAKITPCMENGKGAVAHGMKNGHGCGSTEFHVLRVDRSRLLGKWLYYLTVWPAFRKEAERNMTGSAGQKRVPKSYLENYQINIPTLSEQQLQVQSLNELYTLISLRKQQLAKLDELVKSQFVEMFGDAEHTAYEVSTVGKECTLKSGTTFSSDVEQTEGEYKYAKVSDMNLPGNEVYIKSSKAYVSTDTAGKTPIPAGAVIFPKRGGAIGTNKKRILVEDTCVDLNTMGVIPGARIITEYLYGFFNGMDLMSIADGSTIPQLNNRQIAPLALVVPPLEAQKQFAEFFNQADKSKFAIRQSIEKLETLKKSLMQQYFG